MLKVGDIVRLKSGGPPMTVREVEWESITREPTCEWCGPFPSTKHLPADEHQARATMEVARQLWRSRHMRHEAFVMPGIVTAIYYDGRKLIEERYELSELDVLTLDDVMVETESLGGLADEVRKATASMTKLNELLKKDRAADEARTPDRREVIVDAPPAGEGEKCDACKLIMLGVIHPESDEYNHTCGRTLDEKRELLGKRRP